MSYRDRESRGTELSGSTISSDGSTNGCWVCRIRSLICSRRNLGRNPQAIRDNSGETLPSVTAGLRPSRSENVNTLSLNCKFFASSHCLLTPRQTRVNTGAQRERSDLLLRRVLLTCV